MCGIVGIATTRAIQNRAWLETGRDALVHRGPDDSGMFWSDNGQVGFGHRRLSILDLSPRGHQPMASDDGQVWITYNGEIYNHHELRTRLEALGHRFHSTSDTEVVLAAYRQWGRAMLSHLDGMFAFGIYDAKQGTVLLARDRAGEKPLFYRLANGELRFASELKALFADPSLPRVVDAEALDCYLGFGYVPHDRCMVAGFAKLPPAHALLFDCHSGRVESWRYWDLPQLDPAAASADPEELVTELETLLAGAVRRQLVADVPVGLLLSGGVDSSLITALAVRGGGKLNTYTIGFPQFADYDESEHAARVARHFGTEHVMLSADDVSPDLMPALARQYDEPVVDSSMIPTFLVSQEIRKHCKVAVGGDGGDELFGGYHSASAMARLQWALGRVPLLPRRLLANAATRLLPPHTKGRGWLRFGGTDVHRELHPLESHFEQARRGRLMGKSWSRVAEKIRRNSVPAERDAVQRMTRFDFANYMAEDILVKVDRASMLNSLEIRAPFLDRQVIEFAYAKVPSHLKATPGARKILLRKLAKRVLPPEFDSVRKQGFAIPLDRWLSQGPWRTYAEDVLYADASPFARAEVDRLFQSLGRGAVVSEQLFGLTLFEEWRRQYQVALPAAE